MALDRELALHILRLRAGALLALLLITGCATSTTPNASALGTQQIVEDAVIYEGPELVAVLGYLGAHRSFGDEWLILTAELTSPRGGGPTVIDRSAISIRTPDGRRLALTSEDEYRRRYARLQIPIQRALAVLPLLYRYEQDRMPCGRWFFTEQTGEIAFDEITVSAFQSCSGPLIFAVPGGVQPGRWRLVIDLEESRADIPFLIEAKD